MKRTRRYIAGRWWRAESCGGITYVYKAAITPSGWTMLSAKDVPKGVLEELEVSLEITGLVES